MRAKLYIIFLCIPGFVSAQCIKKADQDSLTAYRDKAISVEEPNPRKLKSFIIPAVFLGYGAISLGNNAVRDLDFSTKNELQEDHPTFANHLDDYSRFAPAVAFYGLSIMGVKSKHGVADGTGLYILSEAIMSASTFGVKRLADRNRPDGSNNYSFPSGHTASAFAAAEFLNQEYRDFSPWIGYAGYTVAAATGALRLYNNKHWVSDVVAGAGFGIVSTKLAYLIYPSLKRGLFGKQKVSYSMVPMYQDKAVGLSFSGVL